MAVVAVGISGDVLLRNRSLDRDGLDEATIFHMAVLPGHRGQGLGRELLRNATRTLLARGVWRIYFDTATKSAPMTYLFESEGWKSLPRQGQPV